LNRLAILLVAAQVSASAFATDHNNLDSGRPLSFDDAKTLAYGERAIEFGGSLDLRRDGKPRSSMSAEFKYGFAKNTEIGIGQSIGEDFAHLSFLRQLRRETDGGPAMAYKLEFGIPTTTVGSGVDLKIRWIASQKVGNYDTLHLNLDINANSRRSKGESSMRFGATVGYQRPIGAPTQFHRTLIGEIGVEQITPQDWSVKYGLGMRVIISPREVVDFGLQARDMRRNDVRFTAGLSIAF